MSGRDPVRAPRAWAPPPAVLAAVALLTMEVKRRSGQKPETTVNQLVGDVDPLSVVVALTGLAGEMFCQDDEGALGRRAWLREIGLDAAGRHEGPVIS